MPYNLVKFNMFHILSPFGFRIFLQTKYFNGTNLNSMPYKHIKSVYQSVSTHLAFSALSGSPKAIHFNTNDISNFETICTTVNNVSRRVSPG